MEQVVLIAAMAMICTYAFTPAITPKWHNTNELFFSFWFLVLLCFVFSPTLAYEGWRGYILAHGVAWAVCTVLLTLFRKLR